MDKLLRWGRAEKLESSFNNVGREPGSNRGMRSKPDQKHSECCVEYKKAYQSLYDLGQGKEPLNSTISVNSVTTVCPN